MDTAQVDEKTKARKEKSRGAITLAMEGQWERAVTLNREILGLFPDDVDALNRLGKALLELGRYPASRDSFESALRISPHNTIAKKNLERLRHLEDSNSHPKSSKVVTPYLFIEESGKSGVSVLQKPASRQVLAKMAAGDAVIMEPRDHALVVLNSGGEYLGKVEPKLGMRLMRLMRGGNGYEAAIISVNRQEIAIIIYETYRHPDMADISWLPSRSKDDHRVYWRDAALRYDIDSEQEEEDEYGPDWSVGDSDGTELSDGDEPTEGAYASKSRARPAAEEDEEEDEE